MSGGEIEGVGLLEPAFDSRGNSLYHPCAVGLHLCGAAAAPGDDYEQPYTALNLAAPSHDAARAMFEAARAEAECGEDEQDFVCDLNLGSTLVGVEHVTDFYTNRQLVPRLVAAANKALGK